MGYKFLKEFFKNLFGKKGFVRIKLHYYCGKKNHSIFAGKSYLLKVLVKRKTFDIVYCGPSFVAKDFCDFDGYSINKSRK